MKLERGGRKMDCNFEDEWGEHLSIRLPKEVKQRATEWSEEQGTSIQDHNLESTQGMRARGANDLYNDCCCGWALSTWLSSRRVWQDCGYFDGQGIDMVVDDSAMGLLPVVICHTVQLGSYLPSFDGITISNRRLVVNDPTTLYVHCSINCDVVKFNGISIMDQIMRVEYITWARPLLYHLPKRKIKVGMEYFTGQCRKTKEQQEAFEGLFKEK